MEITLQKSTLKIIAVSLVLAIVAIFVIKFTGIISFIPKVETSNGNLFAIFFTGLFAGALTCLAVQGGLLAATLAQREQERLEDEARGGNALPILSFLATKIIAYTLLGLLLGYLGSFFTLSIKTQTILQFAVGIFMIGTALNLLNVHPVFRYFVIQPPRFLTRLVRKKSKSKNVFAPAVLGAFTVFIPCGTTQAMMALAIASGSPLSGAAILFAFVLGTSPLFFILGYFATRLGGAFQQRFLKVAALAIILLAAFNINNSLALSGVNIDLGKPFRGAYCFFAVCNSSNLVLNARATDNAVINIEETGYNPSNLTIEAGSQVTLKLNNKGGSGCTQAFTIPSLGIQKVVPLGTSDTIQFTAPSQPGQLAFMCSMGMFRGSMTVI